MLPGVAPLSQVGWAPWLRRSVCWCPAAASAHPLGRGIAGCLTVCELEVPLCVFGFRCGSVVSVGFWLPGVAPPLQNTPCPIVVVHRKRRIPFSKTATVFTSARFFAVAVRYSLLFSVGAICTASFLLGYYISGSPRSRWVLWAVAWFCWCQRPPAARSRRSGADTQRWAACALVLLGLPLWVCAHGCWPALSFLRLRSTIFTSTASPVWRHWCWLSTGNYYSQAFPRAATAVRGFFLCLSLLRNGWSIATSLISCRRNVEMRFS